MSEILSPRDTPDVAAAIHAQLDAVKGLRAAARGDSLRADDRTRVRAWQAQRLATTYPDLLASERFRPAAEFFLSDLYGPKDFSERDDELTRILPTMTKLLPDTAVRAFGAAIELDCLSEALDAGVVAALRAAQPDGPLEVTRERYAAAYRVGDRQADRARQIALVDAIGKALDKVARMRLMAGALAMMHGPARMAGLAEIHEFFQRGFVAFRHMRGAAEFLDLIRVRETRLMERLFAAAETPFDGLA